MVLSLLGGCGAFGGSAERKSETFEGGITELELQALAMEMADDYCAALGETVYLVLEGEEVDPRARSLAVSFLRNGFGAAVDIGSSPNPDVAVLDLLVLAELNTWAFEKHWVPAGIDAERGKRATELLKLAAQDLWTMAHRVLNPGQEGELHELIAQWIEEHPDQVVVSSVRFANFTKSRHMSTVGAREIASGLLSEVQNASAAVEHARLFGERAMWFASRYPWVIGQQAEVTTYRMANQPEFEAAFATIESIGKLSEELTVQVSELDDTADRLVASFREERTATFEELEESLGRLITDALDRLGDEIEQVRVATVDEVFERLREEVTDTLTSLDARSAQLGATLTAAETTALAAADAGRSLHEALQVADHLAGRFDRAPDDPRGSLRLEDLRTTATEAHLAAERLETSLSRVDRWFEEGKLDAEALVSAVFWRATILLAILLVGLALLRLLPSRKG